MADQRSDREYDIVVLGATGYTGELTAEHIVQHLPVNLAWALAGRSQGKLEDLAAKLRQLDTDRVPPAVEVVSLEDKDQLERLMRKTKVCISIVSYGTAGTQVVEACIETGTNYVDACGDTYLVREWIPKFHEKARAAGVAIIVACAMFTAGQDLLTWAAVRELQRATSLKVKEVVLTMQIDAADLRPSGGTVDSMMHGLGRSQKLIKESQRPWALSPIEGGPTSNSASLFGLRRHPDLGRLSASSIAAVQNRAFIHRTWGLLDNGEDYGTHFQYNEFEPAPSLLTAILKVWVAKLIQPLLSVPFVPNLLKSLLPSSGTGPDEKKGKSSIQLKAVATAEVSGDVVQGATPPRTYARLTAPYGPYTLTGACLAQAAASLVHVKQLDGGFAGGILTPAFLGNDFLERLVGAGVEFEVKVL